MPCRPGGRRGRRTREGERPDGRSEVTRRMSPGSTCLACVSAHCTLIVPLSCVDTSILLDTTRKPSDIEGAVRLVEQRGYASDGLAFANNGLLYLTSLRDSAVVARFVLWAAEGAVWSWALQRHGVVEVPGRGAHNDSAVYDALFPLVGIRMDTASI